MWMLLNFTSLILTTCVVQSFELSCCSEDKCIYCPFQKELSKDILQQYPGLFKTVDELQLQLNKSEKRREKGLFESGIDTDLQKHLPGDGDLCCPTEVKYYNPRCYKNEYGELQCIVQGLGLGDKGQFIPKATCNSDYGKCSGACWLEKSSVTLLVWKRHWTLRWWMEFDSFEVPTYCSCKSTRMMKN